MRINDFLSGYNLLAFAVSALFFLKFWRRTSDRFFLMFAIAFFLLALERLGLGIGTHNEVVPYKYLVRLAAFSVILFAIADKNRVPSSS